MQYPTGFPPQSQDVVECALAKAEITLSEALSQLPVLDDFIAKRDAQRYGDWRRIEYAESFVSEVFPVFAHHACEAGRARVWSVRQVREGVDEFVASELIPHAFRRARVMDQETPNSLLAFRDRVLPDLHTSAAWRAYQRELSALADELTHPTPVGRREELDAFLALCRQEPDVSRRVTQDDFSAISGYPQRQSLAEWLTMSPTATKASDQAFRRTLRMPPADFIAALRKLGRLD